MTEENIIQEFRLKNIYETVKTNKLTVTSDTKR